MLDQADQNVTLSQNYKNASSGRQARRHVTQASSILCKWSNSLDRLGSSQSLLFSEQSSTAFPRITVQEML